MPIDIEKIAQEIAERESEIQRDKRNKERQDRAINEYNAKLNVQREWEKLKNER